MEQGWTSDCNAHFLLATSYFSLATYHFSLLTYMKNAKFLIIRLSSIGDVILTSPLVRQLRERFPAAQIDFLIRREYAELVRYNPHLSNILELDVRGGRAELKMMKTRLREAGYNAILDLHGNFRSVFLRSFPNRPPVYKIRKNQFPRFLLVKFKINLYRRLYGHPLSAAEKYLRAAAPLGLSPGDLRTELHLPAEAEKKGEAVWQELSRENFRVAMAPGARHFTKRWPAPYYAELIRALYEKRGWRTLLVGGPDELQTIKEIQRRTGNEIQQSRAGELSLLETFAVMRRAPLFISNDSGLMHAAAAFRIPQIAIFGSTVQELGFFPLNPNARVLENAGLGCRPCSHIGRASCPKGHFKCMQEITPARVMEEIGEDALKE